MKSLRSRKVKLTLSVLSASLLAACGGGGEAGSAAPASSSISNGNSQNAPVAYSPDNRQLDFNASGTNQALSQSNSGTVSSSRINITSNDPIIRLMSLQTTRSGEVSVNAKSLSNLQGRLTLTGTKSENNFDATSRSNMQFNGNDRNTASLVSKNLQTSQSQSP